MVFGSAHFWRFAPLGLCLAGGFMAVQSLWSISWLMQVSGYTRAVAAEHMAGMSGSALHANVFIGLLATTLARRGIRPVQLLGAGLSILLVMLALIVNGGLQQSYLLWLVYGTFSSFGTLAYSQAAAGFPLSLSGRANTAFNLMVFIGAFGVQWGLGLLIDLLQGYGQSPAMAHRSAFLVLLATQAPSLIWFWVAGRWRR